MKKKALLVLIIDLLVWNSVFAYSFSAVAPTGQTLYYNFLSGGRVEVTSQNQSSEYYFPGTSGYYLPDNCPTGTLEIPASVIFYGTTYSVTSIGIHAFRDCSGLISVVIPNTVTTIGADAFNGCGDLTSVTIGDSVTIIGNHAFRNCVSLTSITIPNSVTSINQYAFYGCSSLISLTIPNNVTSIGLHAFYHLRHIEYYGNATGAPWSSFSMNGVTEGDFVFSSSVKDTLTAYLGNEDSIVIPSTVISIGDGCFYNCDSLTSVIIPNSVVLIGNYAFFGCRNLTSLSFPNALTSIGDYSFIGCGGLTSVVIPDSVILIGEQAFKNCSGLTSVTIGRSVTSINRLAFNNCSSLTTVNFNAINCTSMPAVQLYTVFQVFSECNNLTTLNVGDNVVNIPDDAFNDCSSLTSVTIGNSVTSIGSRAFKNCRGLTSVTIPSSVTLIQYYAFQNCSGLTEITSLASIAPTLQIFAFNGVNSTIPINIPCGSVDSYSPTWTCFSAFNELAEFTIDCTSADTIQGTALLISAPTCDSSVAVINATPNYGYHFVQWSDGNTNNPTTITLMQDTSLMAFFAPNQYTITVTSASEARGSVTGGSTVDYLDSVTLTATANYGYHFDHWNDLNTDNPRQLQVTRNRTYTAHFNYNQYSISLLVDTTIHGTCSGSGNYHYLSNRTITANANYGYHFTQWSDGNTNNPRTIMLTQDTSFTAQFAKNLYTLAALSSDTVRGAVTGGETVEYLDTVVLSASANYGYHFAQWNDGNSDNPRSLVVTQDAVYTAQFDKNSYTLSVATADSVMGDVSGSDTAEYLDIMSFAATANYGYHFTMWNDGDTNNPRSITLTQDTGFTAMFAKNLYTLTVLANDTTLGEVTGSTTAEYLDTVSITATITMPHYHFVQWSDGSTAATRNMVISCDSVITAIFAIDTHTVTLLANDDEYGTVSGACIVPYGTEVVIVATANEGYHFAEWSNGSRNNPETITVLNDTTLTAVFTEVVVPEIYMVTVQDGRNVVIWEKGLEVTAYNIYREGSASDVYDLVATIPYSEEPVWTDTASQPRNRSYRYRMTAIDLYGYESEPGGVHKTMHLTISQGVGNEWNLVWTPYEGADYSTYVIYRGTSASNIQQIDVMPSNGNTTYTDDGAPEGTVYYQVGILLSGSTKSGDIILSNIATNETVGIHDITEVGNFNVSICNGQIVVDGAEGNHVWLYDAVGRMIATKQEDFAPIRFNVHASGTYLVKVGNYPARRVVVIR